MNKESYIKAVNRRLNLPKEVKQRVMADFESDLDARLESGMLWETVLAELGSPQKAAADLNEQMKEYAYRKSPWRYLFLVLSVLSGGWLVMYAALLRFGMLLNTLQWSFSSNEAASIGIIGGADGPTAIFVTGGVSAGLDWDVVLIMVIMVVSILAFLRLRRCKPKNI